MSANVNELAADAHAAIATHSLTLARSLSPFCQTKANQQNLGKQNKSNKIILLAYNFHAEVENRRLHM